MSEAVNILFMLPNFDTGGSEKLVVDIVNRLDRTKFNPVVCVFFSGYYEDQIKEAGIPFYVIHENDRIRSKLAVVKFVSDIVKKHKIDVVNTHHSSPLIQGVLPFKIFNKVKWVHTEHTRLDLDPNVTPRILMMEKYCLKFVDHCLGISDGVCEYFKNELNVPESKIVKIYNGIEVSRFAFEPNKANQLKYKYRSEFGLNERDIVIGMFANFRAQKNHLNLINALAELRDQNIENVNLVLAGEGPEKEKVVAEVQRRKLEDNVLFIGMRSDIPELINMIDIYCLPSHFEGLPFSLIEAAIAGKEVVATEVIGNIDVIKSMGRGILVKPDDSQALANGLKKAIASTGKNKHDDDWVPDERFTMNGMIKRYEALFLKP